MVHAFKNSSRIRTYGTAVSLLTSIAYFLFLYVRDGFSPTLLSAVAFLILTLFFTAFISQFLAESNHQKLLRILYEDCDADSFIEQYQVLLQMPNLTTMEQLTLTSHLATAYAYAGQFSLAENLLKEFKTTEGRQKYNEQVLLAGNLTSYALLKGDVPLADQHIQTYEMLLEEASMQKVPLSRSHRGNLEACKVQLEILQGNFSHAGFLSKQIELSPNKLFQLRMRLFLARVLLLDDQKEAAEEQLEIISATQNPTVLQKQAKELLCTFNRK